MRAADSKTKTIAISGILAAVTVLLLTAGSLLPTLSLGISAVAGFAVGAARVRSGRISAICVWLISSLFSLVFAPDKSPAILFAAFFGVYPILKSEFERIKSKLIAYVVKYVYFNITLLATYPVLKTYVSEDVLESEYLVWVFVAAIVAANIAFLLYDIAFGGIMNKYYKTLLTIRIK